MKKQKSDIKELFYCIASLLFFVIFALAIFIGVSLFAPKKPALFESIDISNFSSNGGDSNEN